MTKEFRMRPGKTGRLDFCFVLRASLVIRHSSFGFRVCPAFATVLGSRDSNLASHLANPFGDRPNTAFGQSAGAGRADRLRQNHSSPSNAAGCRLGRREENRRAPTAAGGGANGGG